ncbi:Shr3 amino acid permease chaperone [Ilyonectria destructans]|nr:Shr3 amino acid permease chaperone [Ilyonectria destructans]
MSSYIDYSKTTKSSNYQGTGSFATFMIIAPVCFFLGVLFASFPYDFPLLWTKAPVTDDFLNHLETHLKFLHQSPPLISRILHIIISVGFIGFFIKLFRPSEANFLFDGASLILYIIGFGVYVANIIKGLRTVSADIWSDDEFKGQTHDGEHGEMILGREDTLKVLSASNTILALVLVGILVLQAGQWYAEKKDADDIAAADKKDADKKDTAEKKEASPSKAANKKKQ